MQKESKSKKSLRVKTLGFGDWLRVERKLQGLNTRELAEMAGCGACIISLYQAGRQDPKYSTARAIGRALGDEKLALVMAGFIPKEFRDWVIPMVLERMGYSLTGRGVPVYIDKTPGEGGCL